MPALGIRLFATDVDGTLFQGDEASARFKHVWDALDRGRRPILVYNTARSVAEIRSLMSAGKLANADYIIGRLGTEFHEALYNRPTDFQQRFNDGWNPELVRRIVMQTPGIGQSEVNPDGRHECCWTWPQARHEDLASLSGRLAAAGLKVSLDLRGGRQLDVRPAHADMGKALSWLGTQLNIAPNHMLVAAACRHASSMLRMTGVHRLLVRNGCPELLADVAGLHAYNSALCTAEGVLDGLRHFHVLPSAPAMRNATTGDR